MKILVTGTAIQDYNKPTVYEVLHAYITKFYYNRENGCISIFLPVERFNGPIGALLGVLQILIFYPWMKLKLSVGWMIFRFNGG